MLAGCQAVSVMCKMPGRACDISMLCKLSDLQHVPKVMRYGAAHNSNVNFSTCHCQAAAPCVLHLQVYSDRRVTFPVLRCKAEQAHMAVRHINTSATRFDGSPSV